MNILKKLFNAFFSSTNYPTGYFINKYNIDNNINNGFKVDEANLSKDFSKAYEQVITNKNK